jgi:tetratricopeptide (TPR) repeat protein
MAGRWLERTIEPKNARILIACLAFLVYAPCLFGEFVYEDERFIEVNPAVTDLTWSNVVRYFTDPTSHAVVGHDVFRPLRTFEFAVDWALSGGRPWLFHLHSMAYHVVVCLLLFSVLRRLLGAAGNGAANAAALFGTLAFGLHPVHTESVAWISSRADVMVLFWILFALRLYLRDRLLLAALAFAGALLSKETGVFFVAAVLLVDLFRRADRRWLWYGIYGVMAIAFVAIWINLVFVGKAEHVGHLKGQLWGGSYVMTLLTMAKGFLHYLRVMVLPVHFTVDYHVATSTGLGWHEALALVVLALIVTAAVTAGRRSRFALAWFFVALLPASNLIRPIGIPTAERFLYLPMAGLAIWLGPLLARYRRSALVLLACLFVLTLLRTRTWRSDDALWDAAIKVAPTPRGLDYLARREIDAAHEARQSLKGLAPDERSARENEMRAHAEAVIDRADGLYHLYERVILLPPGTLAGRNMSRKANALVLLGRPVEALVAAKRAIKDWGRPLAYFNAALACQELKRWEAAALYLQAAHEGGYDISDLRPSIASMWLRSAAEKEGSGNRSGALRDYRRSWETVPDPVRNPDAFAAIRRLGG